MLDFYKNVSCFIQFILTDDLDETCSDESDESDDDKAGLSPPDKPTIIQRTSH